MRNVAPNARKPLSTSPFTRAPIPCSRMPQCRLRPPYWPPPAPRVARARGAPPAVLAALHAPAVLDQRQRRRREVGGPAGQLGDFRGRPLDHLVGGLAGGDHAGVRALARDVGVPAVGQAARQDALDLVLVGVRLEARLPLRAEL